MIPKNGGKEGHHDGVMFRRKQDKQGVGYKLGAKAITSNNELIKDQPATKLFTFSMLDEVTCNVINPVYLA